MNGRIVKQWVAFVCTALLAAGSAIAAGKPYQDDPEKSRCVQDASAKFGVPAIAIWVLLDVEGGKVGEVSWNSNGTYDIGPMQINSSWLKSLAKFGISDQELRDNLCLNIGVGSWIFAKELDRHKSLPKAIAFYHSPTGKHQYRYLGLAMNALDRRIARMKREDNQG